MSVRGIERRKRVTYVTRRRSAYRSRSVFVLRIDYTVFGRHAVGQEFAVDCFNDYGSHLSEQVGLHERARVVVRKFDTDKGDGNAAVNIYDYVSAFFSYIETACVDKAEVSLCSVGKNGRTARKVSEHYVYRTGISAYVNRVDGNYSACVSAVNSERSSRVIGKDRISVFNERAAVATVNIEGSVFRKYETIFAADDIVSVETDINLSENSDIGGKRYVSAIEEVISGGKDLVVLRSGFVPSCTERAEKIRVHHAVEGNSVVNMRFDVFFAVYRNGDGRTVI